MLWQESFPFCGVHFENHSHDSDSFLLCDMLLLLQVEVIREIIREIIVEKEVCVCVCCVWRGGVWVRFCVYT